MRSSSEVEPRAFCPLTLALLVVLHRASSIVELAEGAADRGVMRK